MAANGLGSTSLRKNRAMQHPDARKIIYTAGSCPDFAKSNTPWSTPFSG
jgi:hypothetical protein